MLSLDVNILKMLGTIRYFNFWSPPQAPIQFLNLCYGISKSEL